MKLSILLIFTLISIQGFAHTIRTMTGNRVIDREGRLGTVIKNIGNGQVQVRFDRNLRGEEILSTARLSPAIDRTERFQIGDRIITGSDQTGTVRELFLNGKADVHFDTMVGGYIRDIADLKAGEIREGDRVIDHEGHLGIVVKVYEIGAAKVNYDLAFGAQAVSLASLNRAVKELGSLKVGDEVELSGVRNGDRRSESKNRLATIRELFENGIIEVFIEGRSGTNLVRASEISLPEASGSEGCSDLLRRFSEF